MAAWSEPLVQSVVVVKTLWGLTIGRTWCRSGGDDEVQRRRYRRGEEALADHLRRHGYIAQQGKFLGYLFDSRVRGLLNSFGSPCHWQFAGWWPHSWYLCKWQCGQGGFMAAGHNCVNSPAESERIAPSRTELKAWPVLGCWGQLSIPVQYREENTGKIRQTSFTRPPGILNYDTVGACEKSTSCSTDLCLLRFWHVLSGSETVAFLYEWMHRETWQKSSWEFTQNVANILLSYNSLINKWKLLKGGCTK